MDINTTINNTDFTEGVQLGLMDAVRGIRPRFKGEYDEYGGVYRYHSDYAAGYAYGYRNYAEGYPEEYCRALLNFEAKCK